jgi:hypothetical protein
MALGSPVQDGNMEQNLDQERREAHALLDLLPAES